MEVHKTIEWHKICKYFLPIVIILQILIGVKYFSYKNVYMQDEYYTYGISNSYYQPYIFSLDDNIMIRNKYNTYLNGDDFKYYLRTNEDTKFSYDSVIYNSSCDTTPPIYYLLLHTISSMFPNKFSWWWGFGINCVAHILSQLFLYKIFLRISKSEPLSFLICTLWGFSLACMYHLLYIRMYTLLNTFTCMFIYFFSMYAETKKKKYIPLITVSVLLGFLTHYLFAGFAFFFTGLYCFVMLLKKQIKPMFLCGIAAAAGMILSFVIFPAAIRNTFKSNIDWTNKGNFLFQFHMFVGQILRDMIGVTLSEESNTTVIFLFLSVFLFVSAAVITAVLFPKEGYTKRFFKYMINELKVYFSGNNQTLFCVFAASVIYLCYVSKSVSYYALGSTGDRYFFIIMPLMIGCVFCFLYYIGSKIRKHKTAKIIYTVLACILMCIACANSHFSAAVKIYALRDGHDNIAEILDNENVIVVAADMRYMMCYCQMLEEANDIYYTLSDMDIYKGDVPVKEYESFIGNTDHFYLFFDTNSIYGSDENSQKVIEYFEEISGFKPVLSAIRFADTNRIELYEYQKQPN